MKKKKVNIEKLIEKYFNKNTLVLIQGNSTNTYHDFLKTINKYLPDFTEDNPETYEASIKDVILQNKTNTNTYGVLFNFSNNIARIVGYSKLLSRNSYMFGVFSTKYDKCISMSYGNFLIAIHDCLEDVYEDNNLEKEPIYLTQQLKEL